MQRYPELYPQEEEKEDPASVVSDSATTADATTPDSAVASESDSASSVSRPETDTTLPKDG